MSPSANKRRLTVDGSASMTAAHYTIESPGMQDGSAGVGVGGAPIPLIGRYSSDGKPHFGPAIPAQTIDEARVVASGEGCSDIRSTLVGRDSGHIYLDQIKRAQFISYLSLYRFKLPLKNALSPNPNHWLQTAPGTLTNQGVFLERQDPPLTPPGFVQILDENNSVDLVHLLRHALFGESVPDDQHPSQLSWNLPTYPITRDLVLRGRIVDILQQFAEPFSHCESLRPVIIGYQAPPSDRWAGESRVYVGPLEGFPAGKTIGIDYATAKISHWEYREYRGPTYGLVTIIGGIDPKTVAEFDLAPETSVSVSYDQQSHIIQSVITIVFHRAGDNAVYHITRIISEPATPDDPAQGSPPDGSGDIMDINATQTTVEETFMQWEALIIEPKTQQVVNRPVELSRTKIVTVDSHQTSMELTTNNYDAYKRLAGSLTVTQTTDPDTHEVTFAQSEAKTYPRASLIEDYVRIATGDIEALTHVPGGAGSMPRRGHPFTISEVVDDSPGAVDVTIQNEFLDGPMMNNIFALFTLEKRKSKKHFVFHTSAMPWVNVGDRIDIANVVDSEGNPCPFATSGVVADVHQLADFSDEHPEEVQEITLQRWEK